METGTTPRISDEVWAAAPRRRPPYAAVMSCVVAATLLLVASIAVAQAGLVVPRLEISESGSSSKAGSGTFQFRFWLTNAGATDVTVTDIRPDAPWLTASSTTTTTPPWQGAGAIQYATPLPLVIAPRSSTEVSVQLVVDCAARTADQVPLVVEASSLVGSHTLSLQPGPTMPLQGDGPVTEYLVWPQAQVDWVCNPYRGADAGTE